MRGVQAGYASPVSDGERLYLLDNGGVLFAFDVKTGKQLWRETLGTIAKASPVLADGKLYIGTENTGDAGGKFYIIRPPADRAEILDQDWLRHAGEIRADHRVADRRARPRLRHVDGRAVRDRTQGLRPQSSRRHCGRNGPRAAGTASAAAGPAATLLVTPTELILKPGESIALTVKAFDAQRQCRRQPGRGDVDAREPEGHGRGRQVHGRTPPPARRPARQGDGRQRSPARRASASSPTCRGRSTSRAAAIPAGALDQRDRQVRGRAVDGSKVLVKLAENPFAFAKRTRPFFGPPISATTRSKRTSARWRSAARWATSASSRSATSWCCSATTSGSSCSPGSPRPSAP